MPLTTPPAQGAPFPANFCDTGHGYDTTLPPVSSTPTPNPTTVSPVAPPSRSACAPTPTGKYRDSHENAVSSKASFFCSAHASATAAPTSTLLRISHDVHMKTMTGLHGAAGRVPADYSGTNVEDDVYSFSVESVDGCGPDGGVYEVASPVGRQACADMMTSVWHDCKAPLSVYLET